MKLQFHEEALREYDKAMRWYVRRSLTAPLKFAAEVDEATERILAAPQIFPTVHPGRRKALLRKFPYMIVFEWTPDAINVIAVAHAKRKVAYWRRRQMNS